MERRDGKEQERINEKHQALPGYLGVFFPNDHHPDFYSQVVFVAVAADRTHLMVYTLILCISVFGSSALKLLLQVIH